jgi:integrase
MAIYKRGKIFWYKFTFNGEQIRASTKTGNQRAAEQIEAARKTQLAKGEVGIRDRKPAPTLAEFAENSFIPFVEKHKKDKPRTIEFYKMRVSRLKTFPRLWGAKLDAIRPEDVTAYIGARQALEMETSTINRDLATLRRMFKLAMEWEAVSKLLPQVRLLAGENRRERVVTPAEEASYLAVAGPLLKDFAVIAFDCGLRPDESYRLKWSQIRQGNIEVHRGKTKESRRSIPASPRVMEMLERRGREAAGECVFPAPTRTGHINSSSLKKHHATALKEAKIEAFVIYALRHTCLTRWAESGMDVFTLKKLAGHANISTTMRYVHMNDATTRAAIEKAWSVQGGHKNGHTTEKDKRPQPKLRPVKPTKQSV